MLSVFTLNVIILNVVMLSVVMMSVVALQNDKALLLKYIFDKNKHTGNKRLQSYICL
jgi:hypothetical protein